MFTSILNHVAVRGTLAMAFLAAVSACGSHAANDSGGDASMEAGRDDSTPDANPSDGSPEAAPVDAGQAGFPVGTYDNCAFDTFLQAGGGGDVGQGGAIVVHQTGPTLTVGYGGDGGYLDASFEFTPTSPNSATLVAGQRLDGVEVGCAPLESAPAITQLSSGSLTFDNGTLFFSVIGTAEPLDAGRGCTNPGGSVGFVVTCGGDTVPDGGAGLADSAGSASGFVGVYTCASDENQYQPGSLEANNSGSGILTVTKTGGLLTAAYANDTALSGSLKFEATTDNAALQAASNETLQFACFGSGGGQTVWTATALTVQSSTLTLDGTSVVLSFAGTSCNGEQVTGSLLCVLQANETPDADPDAAPSDASVNDAK
jgi:hypothetical protein